MANADIGHIDCPACGEQANVRESKNHKAYIMCPSPVCGFQGFARGGDSDKHIRAKMKPVGQPEPEPQPQPQPTPVPVKKKGFFDDLAF